MALEKGREQSKNKQTNIKYLLSASCSQVWFCLGEIKGTFRHSFKLLPPGSTEQRTWEGTVPAGAAPESLLAEPVSNKSQRRAPAQLANPLAASLLAANISGHLKAVSAPSLLQKAQTQTHCSIFPGEYHLYAVPQS